MADKNNILEVVMDVVRPFVPTGIPLDSTTQLTGQANLDSASMVGILLELESRLSIQLSASDLTFDHFESCESLANALSPRLSD